jgi:hypothetical protein
MLPEYETDELKEIIFGEYRIIFTFDDRFVNILTVQRGSMLLPINEVLP